MNTMHKKNILLVDDDRSFLQIILKSIEDKYPEGAFLTAESGNKALDIIKNTAIDLLVTDVFMPEINGFELLVSARKLSPGLKVIIMTAQPNPELAKQAYEKGSVGYIEKPFSIDRLVSMIRDAFVKPKKSFDGEMEGLQIADIIQLNCMARHNIAVFMSDGNKEGSIFFENGNIIHAESNGFEGEEALKDIINWPGGSFSTRKNIFSPKKTIQKKWEQLLIETFVSVDESARGDFILTDDINLDQDITLDTRQETSAGNNRIRVLIVDDSKIITKGISEILSQDSGIEVIGEAADGRQAIEKVAQLRPDVVTLDLNMPEMDGLTALKHIMIMQPTPVVMLSAYTQEGATATFDSLRFGAVDFIAKPSTRQDLALDIQKKNIIEKVKRASEIKISTVQHIRVKKTEKTLQNLENTRDADLAIAVGAAMGGYGALIKIITRLPSQLKACVLILQYMPAEIIAPFSEYLNIYSQIFVKPAVDGEVIKDGVCYLCADSHYMTTVSENGVKKIRLNDRPFNFEHRNSFNMLLFSLAEIFTDKTIGVILSGEGNDGLEGAQEIKRVGGRIIVQNHDTCLAPEMPEHIVQNGLADKMIPDFLIAREIMRELGMSE
jgi:two-component system, chemotaxis family, protein-glutamate methylesterase/glutaminase